MSNPANEYWTALKRVLRYLNGTKEVGISYKKAPEAVIMEAWTDSSWGEDPDDSRSTHGHLIFVGGGSVSWKSAKQQPVALSSTEAEYVGQSSAAPNVMWTRSY